MTEVNPDLTKKIADLARLDLSSEELSLFTEQIKKTLNYVELLSQCKTDGVEPMIHPFDANEMKTPMREDAVVPPLVDENGKPKILKSAPDVLYGGFKVPPIIG